MLAHPLERPAMDGAAAVLPDGLPMGLGGIPFVAAKSEFGVKGVGLGHDAVPGDLGHDGGGGDGQAAFHLEDLPRSRLALDLNPENIGALTKLKEMGVELN